MENTNIKEWYIKTFPTDELGYEIHENISFADLLRALDSQKDVYDLLGMGDSIVRERVFARLAEILKVDYKYVYDKWLEADDIDILAFMKKAK